MIPAIDTPSPLLSDYQAFIEKLCYSGFEGDIQADFATRTVLSTDNSIYQMLPQGVLFPRSTADLQRIARLSNAPRFTSVTLAPRGGGTGTNGQSLTEGLMVDISRHMNQILEINAEERWVRVQAGVVKDQLNEAIAPYGLFFAPELSTSNRATLGGMINTDASGQGSCAYGKTRDHVLELSTVFLDGTLFTSSPIEDDALAQVTQRQDRVGELHRVLDTIHSQHKDEIAEGFPELNRCLTGYDLAHIRTDDGLFDLNSILCGSEGTLGFICEAKLNLLPIPTCSALVNVKYADFNAALRDAQQLMNSGPTSIETVDSKVLNLAMNDIVWNSVAEYFPSDASQQVQGINLVEFTADSTDELQQLVERLTGELDRQAKTAGGDVSAPRLGYSVAMGTDAVNKVWGMRKRAVGLLGNAKGEARPIPFVEDTAVPPQNLADYILEFRALLDSHNLQYGMFGHVDAGVLHVRPAIDMKDPQQAALVRPISDGVAALTKKYKGLLWGEHGKGVRSEYAPEFFGDLYPLLQKVKASCDPHNQLNPGKIATPDDSVQLYKIDEVPTRGDRDKLIPTTSWDAFKDGMYCNGNGACYNWNPNDAMCPSWKATRQRIHSPKGRASLVKEWLTQLSQRNFDPVAESSQLKRKSFLTDLSQKISNTRGMYRGEYDFSHEVMESMAGCLACKSCAGQCPIKVDVPTFRSSFMELYYGRYLRPLKHYVIGGLESLIPVITKIPRLYNAMVVPQVMRNLTRRAIGMEDSPALSTINLQNELFRMGVPLATEKTLASLSPQHRQRAVILVQDAFTSFFETPLILDLVRLLLELDFFPMLAPYKANGKPLHVHGFLKAFERTAKRNASYLRSLSNSGIPLVGVDPSMTLTYRSEYQKLLGDQAPRVLLLQEWLAESDEKIRQQAEKFTPGSFTLMPHCTESTNAAASIKQWQSLFEALGQNLSVAKVGCCGMAGTYGHESVNLENSKALYEMSWQPLVEHGNLPTPVATGYSCRSQIKRFSNEKVAHPLQALLKQRVN